MVMIWVASVAHMIFGATVMMCRSCGVSSRLRARCGDSRAFSRISRSTRLRATRMPSIEAQLRVALNNSQYATLVADEPGVVTAVLAEPGQVVAQGQSVFRIARLGDLDVVADVP